MLIDWFTVAAQVVNFLILVWLLKRFLYKPVLAAIDEREKRIATQLQDAEKKKAEALKEQAEFQHKNEELDHQRVALLADAATAAKTEREKLIAAARHDAVPKSNEKGRNKMEGNGALKVFATLRRFRSKEVTDAELRKTTGLRQGQIDIAAEELEREGMIVVTRTYRLAE